MTDPSPHTQSPAPAGKGGALGWIAAHWRLLAAAAALAFGLLCGYLIWSGSDGRQRAETSSDTAPAEFYYLDNARVRAYLGQALGGLSDSQKRTLSSTASAEAKVDAGPIGEVSGSRGRESSVEETVTPQTADLFLTMLEYLRTGGQSKREFLKEFPIRTRVASRRPVLDWLNQLSEGDFVRLTQAHLFLPPFAALVPRARPAAPFEDGRFLRRSDGRAPTVDDNRTLPPQRDIDAYVKGLVEADTRLPFVVPIMNLQGNPLATILIPAQYSAILDNTRLLAGNLTVVGKVVYIERRFTDDPNCKNLTRGPCTYVDRETALDFGPALEQAAPSIRTALRLNGTPPTKFLTDTMTFDGPLVVLLPVAIYQ